MANSYDLQRFVEGQRNVFDTSFAELQAGSKQTHWMWFIFPQLAGLGRSPTAQYYAISSLEEARAYLAHPLLGPRLRHCAEALLHWSGRRTAEQIFGRRLEAKVESDAVRPSRAGRSLRPRPC